MIATLEGLDPATSIIRFRLRSTNPADALELKIAVDLKNRLLLFDPITDVCFRQPADAAGAQAVIDSLKLQKFMIGNGIFEVYEAGTTLRLGRTEHYLSNNLDLQKSISNIDNDIAMLKAKFGLP